MLAPRANVSFTTFAYVSPVQTIPSCDQTGTPAIAFDGFLHFRSSIISGSASRISARMRARVSSRQSPRSLALARSLAPARLRFCLASLVFDADGLRLWSAGVQSVRRPLRHLVAYGSTNRYRPVNRSKASGSSGE